MFYHPTRELWCVVHGDDFVFTGFQEDLDFALGIMENEYEIKNRGTLGPSEGDVKEIGILSTRRRVSLGKRTHDIAR